MALVVEHNLIIHQLDVTTAYLNGVIEENIYKEVPEFFEELLPEMIIKEKMLKGRFNPEGAASKMLKDIQNGNKVCLMKKALYGLKQAKRQWYKRLDVELRALGLKPLNADACVYVRNCESVHWRGSAFSKVPQSS